MHFFFRRDSIVCLEGHRDRRVPNAKHKWSYGRLFTDGDFVDCPCFLMRDDEAAFEGDLPGDVGGIRCAGVINRCFDPQATFDIQLKPGTFNRHFKGGPLVF